VKPSAGFGSCAAALSSMPSVMPSGWNTPLTGRRLPGGDPRSLVEDVAVAGSNPVPRLAGGNPRRCGLTGRPDLARADERAVVVAQGEPGDPGDAVDGQHRSGRQRSEAKGGLGGATAHVGDDRPLAGRRDPYGGTAPRRSIENERSSWPCHLDQDRVHGSATGTARPRGVGERLDVRRNDSVGLDRAFPRAAHRHSVAVANARSCPYGHGTGDRRCRRAASGEPGSQRRKAGAPQSPASGPRDRTSSPHANTAS
jgi:hypothetical protein